MFAVNLRSRTVVAVVGLCAVVGLMAVSLGTVQAGAVQTEEEAKQVHPVAPQIHIGSSSGLSAVLRPGIRIRR